MQPRRPIQPPEGKGNSSKKTSGAPNAVTKGSRLKPYGVAAFTNRMNVGSSPRAKLDQAVDASERPVSFAAAPSVTIVDKRLRHANGDVRILSSRRKTVRKATSSN